MYIGTKVKHRNTAEFDDDVLSTNKHKLYIIYYIHFGRVKINSNN